MITKNLLREIIEMSKLHIKMVFYHVFLLIHDPFEIIKDYNYDKRLGVETTATYFPKGHTTLYRDEFHYAAVEYRTLEKIINYLELKEDDVFVDFGCGKGRIIIFAATKKIKKAVGIEYDKALADIAKNNIASLKLRGSNIEVIHSDAATFDPKEGTVFFMNNPFGWKTLLSVLDNIAKSIRANPRNVRIVYRSRLYSVFLETIDWLEAEGRIEGTEFCVWHNKRF